MKGGLKVVNRDLESQIPRVVVKHEGSGWVILAAFFNYFAIGITVVPLKLLINKQIAGDADDPNSASAFVDTTNIFLYAFMSFLCGRYMSGFGDYIGRKPLFVLASLNIIFTRAIYINSTNATGFYIGAIVGGTFDCFYYTGLAWICDLNPDPKTRNKRVGIYIGVVLGLSLTISAPLGAILATTRSLTFPFFVSPIFSLLSIFVTIFIPVDDTLGILKEDDQMYKFSIHHKRGLPVNWSAYLVENFPISKGSFALIGMAKHKYDWLTNFAMHICPALFAVVLVQYCFAVFKWSAPQASIAVFSIGGCLGLFAPCLLSRYDPVPLAFHAMCLFTFGLFILSAAGTGLDVALSSKLGVAGIGCIAMGTSWIPALQTNLTNQYGPDIQGLISGLLSQEKDFAILPAYVISLAFTFSLRRDWPIYWPGSSFFLAACCGVTAIYLHYSIYGSEATTLTLRTSTNPPNNDPSVNNQSAEPVESVELTKGGKVSDRILLRKFLEAIDARDGSTAADLFTADAEWRTNTPALGTVFGRKGIESTVNTKLGPAEFKHELKHSAAEESDLIVKLGKDTFRYELELAGKKIARITRLPLNAPRSPRSSQGVSC